MLVYDKTYLIPVFW